MKEKELLFIKKEAFFTTAHYLDYNESINSFFSFLNVLAKKHLMDIKGYRRRVKSVLQIKSKVPIYFSNRIFLFYVHEKNGCEYWINYFQLAHISWNNGQAYYIFRNGYTLKAVLSQKALRGLTYRNRCILNYINNL